MKEIEKFSISIKWWLVSSFHFIFLIAVPLQAQIKQSLRYEIPLANWEGNFEIIPADTSGLYVYRTFAGFPDDQLQLIKLDTAFHEKWSGYLAIEKNYALMGQRSFGNKLFLLFRYKDYTKNDLMLFAIEHSTGNFRRYIVRSAIPFAPTEFQLTSNAALIGGYFNKVPVVLYFSFLNLNSKVLPGLFNETGELNQVRTYADGSFDVLISALNYKRQRTIWVKNYDAEGGLLKNLSLHADDNKHLIFGRSVKIDNDQQIVAGVYGTRNAAFSRGMFISSIDPSGFEKTRYYNFADLENFFKYMKARREKRVKSRIERKKIKGKKIRFNYRFLVHEIIPYKDQYILLGEAFYPKYRRIDDNGFFRSLPTDFIIQNGMIFEGYFYTHAVVMGFNTDGKLLWDNSFEINDVRTFTLQQFVKLELQQDKIALLYLFDNEIRTKIIKGHEVLEGKAHDPIRTMEENEVVAKQSTKSRLEYWYGDNLYAYGVQEVMNINTASPGKRRVFYINKVTYPQ